MSGRIQSYNRYLVLSDDNAYPAHVLLGVGVTELPVRPADVSVNGAVVAISSTATAGTVVALYRLDGEDPSAILGMPLYAGGEIQLFEGEIDGFRIVPVGASAQTMMVEFGIVS